MAVELPAELSSHQHQASTVMVLANQPSLRIPLAQGVCQGAGLPLARSLIQRIIDLIKKWTNQMLLLYNLGFSLCFAVSASV